MLYPLSIKQEKGGIKWKIVLACICWFVWAERNRRYFKDKQCNIQKFILRPIILFINFLGVNRKC